MSGRTLERPCHRLERSCGQFYSFLLARSDFSSALCASISRRTSSRRATLPEICATVSDQFVELASASCTILNALPHCPFGLLGRFVIRHAPAAPRHIPVRTTPLRDHSWKSHPRQRLQILVIQRRLAVLRLQCDRLLEPGLCHCQVSELAHVAGNGDPLISTRVSSVLSARSIFNRRARTVPRKSTLRRSLSKFCAGSAPGQKVNS
jgi:hypothetical protein